MNSYHASFQISSIIYDNMDTNVLIKGETFKEHLSYHTEFMINFSELNHIMNILQQQNPEICVSELFEEEQLDLDYQLFTLSGKNLENKTIILDHCLLKTDKKQIRA